MDRTMLKGLTLDELMATKQRRESALAQTWTKVDRLRTQIGSARPKVTQGRHLATYQKQLDEFCAQLDLIEDACYELATDQPH